MTSILDEPIGIVQSTIITFLLYIQLFKEIATFKLHFALIVLPCKQQNVTYIRFLGRTIDESRK